MPPQTNNRSPKIITTIDDDTIRVVVQFRDLRKDKTNSAALEKLIARSQRLNLHRMSEEQFDALVDRLTADGLATLT